MENQTSTCIIKGNVEKDIRSAYFGGNVDVYVNEINKGYYYDINSQYPYAMLKDMPVGNPIFSLDKNLFNYFGFVYGEITAPSSERLRVPIIQYRDEDGNVSCPRGKFKRMIFTEEIKDAIMKYGYSMNVEYGYKFERGEFLFKDYVEHFYDIKKKSKEGVSRKNAKLMLNSLYGKFGMKEIYSKIKIVNRNQAMKLYKNYNCNEFADLGEDKVLIKYTSRISENIRKMFKKSDNDEYEMSNVKITNIGLRKKRGIPSAIHIAAAISSYAKMIINEFKNIPDNPCVMSDTDSGIFTKKLDDKYIGNNIGEMKLEYVINKAIFIRKKLYCLQDDNNNIIAKASGVNSNNLTYIDFESLLCGENVQTKNIQFNVKWKDLSINIENKEIVLSGLKGNVTRINNSVDGNMMCLIEIII